MKIGVLCSHQFVFPSLNLIGSKGKLAGAASPDRPEILENLYSVCNNYFAHMAVLEKNNDQLLDNWLELSNPDVVFVFGFPFKIKKKYLNIPEKGFYNFHTGLLPKYRGIDPVFWQIKNGESSGGISVHQMDENIDTGPLIHMEKTRFLKNETYGMHMQRLSFLAAEAASNVIDKLEHGKIEIENQKKTENYRFLKRPSMDELTIKWSDYEAEEIKNLVQAANPAYGGALTFYCGRCLRIIQVNIIKEKFKSDFRPGEIISTKKGLNIFTRDERVINIDILFSDAGIFTGKRFAENFVLRTGQILSETINLKM